MDIMNTNVFIWNLLWSILLVSTTCKSATLNTSEETTLPTTSITTTATTTTIRPPSMTSHNMLVLCQCGTSEVMDHIGQCQWLDNGTSVPTKPSPRSETQLIDTTEFSVTVKEPRCQYRQVILQEDQFILRLRGGSTDMLVMEGDFRGLRLTDYCIHHRLSGGQVKVTAQGCVSEPDIPRCCPQGKHMANDDCVPNTIPSVLFKPPLATGPHGDKFLAGAPFPWTEHKEHMNKLICTSDNVLKKVELDGQNAYLAVLPQFVLLTWHPKGEKRQMKSPPHYCVDVPGDDDTYYAYSCQRDLDAYCKHTICTYKCCPEGQALNKATKGCVASNLPFKPPFSIPPSSLTTMYSFPTCKPITDIAKFQLLQNGTLIHRNNIYTFPNFCTDIFLNDNSTDPGALACIKDIQETNWHKVRRILYPMCIGMSCAFLALLLLLHAWIPKLRENGGIYQLFHAISLFVAYSVTLVLQVLKPRGYVMRETCMFSAFVLQFALLSAFFWLNTMCFDIWRLFRTKVGSKGSFVPSVAAWKYILYGLGGPVLITGITIIVQFVAPKDGSIPGLVHPHIGEGRCWFKSDTELLPYLYGPVAVLFLLNFIFIGIAYHYVRIIRKEHNSSNDPISESTNGSAETTKTSYDIAAFWQQFYLLVLLAVSWLTEILQIHHEELWAPVDLLNNLGGVFVFFVFLTHYSKRSLLMEQLPKLLEFSNMWINQTREAQTNINNTNNMLSKKLSPSRLISNQPEQIMLNSYLPRTSDL